MLKWAIVLGLAVLMLGCGNPAAYVIQGGPGPKGDTGSAGTNGSGCDIVQITIGSALAPYGGALISCSGNTVLLSNGAPGHDGSNGHDGNNGHDGADAQPSAYSVAELVDPCGASGGHDEVFLRLANGKLLASFSDNVEGRMTRLSEIKDGVGYMTTDNTGCTFTVSTSGGTRTISWSGGSKSWPFY